MQKDISSMPTALLSNKVNIILSELGMLERYNAFQYLSYICVYMIKQNSDSQQTYQECLKQCSERFGVSERAVACGLMKLLKTCSAVDIIDRAQFNLGNNRTLNKIRVVKNYILTRLTTPSV